MMFLVPGCTISIAPPQAHSNLESWVNAGLPPTKIVGFPGTHGAGMIGMHGMGVMTPRAAAVAAATIGLAMLWHMPKGGMLTMGMLSITDASGMDDITLDTGNTCSIAGVIPNAHLIIAPPQTHNPIRVPPSYNPTSSAVSFFPIF